MVIRTNAKVIGRGQVKTIVTIVMVMIIATMEIK